MGETNRKPRRLPESSGSQGRCQPIEPLPSRITAPCPRRPRNDHSTQLGRVLGFTDAQVRKDLAYFGQFGYPGIGYRCSELIDAIKGILGTKQPWPIAIVGLGNLGRALMGYRGFQQQGFQIVAAFDTDPAKIGKSVEGIEIFDLDQVQQITTQRQIRMAVIAVLPRLKKSPIPWLQLASKGSLISPP